MERREKTEEVVMCGLLGVVGHIYASRGMYLFRYALILKRNTHGGSFQNDRRHMPLFLKIYTYGVYSISGTSMLFCIRRARVECTRGLMLENKICTKN